MISKIIKFIRTLLKVTLIMVVLLAMLSGGFYLWARDKHVVPIIMYHSINYPDKNQSSIVSPEVFEKQMEFLKRNKFEVITLEALAEAIQQNIDLPKKTVVITFDDGYEDNYIYAYPVLSQYEFPAIIFVSPDLVGQSNYLTWPQIREMASNRIMIGSHTIKHSYLPKLSTDEQRLEIRESKRALERKLGKKIEFMAYPSGGYNEETKVVLREFGFKAACTTNRGFDRLNHDVFALKRVKLTNNDRTDILLWAKLSGYYLIFKKGKNPY